MEMLTINAETRTTTGNSPARGLRRAGRLPAVLYGPKRQPVSLSIDTAELERLLKSHRGTQILCNLSVAGDKTRPVMVKEIQTKPVSNQFLHVDFYEIDMQRKLRVKVPVTTIGKSVGVERGGMLQIIRRELEVLCLPMAIPEEITLDVTDLDIGEAIHVEDISVSDDVEIPADVNFTVLTVLAAKMAEEEEVSEEELEEGEEEEEETEEE